MGYSISAHKDCSMNSVPDQNNLKELKQRLGLLPQPISTEKYSDYSDYIYNGTEMQKEDMRRKRETEPVNRIEEIDSEDILLAISNDSIDSLKTSNGTSGNSAPTTLSTNVEGVPAVDNN